VLVPRNLEQTIDKREVLVTNMQYIGNHNLLQHDLMVEMWEKWNDEHGDKDTDDDNNMVDANKLNMVVVNALLAQIQISSTIFLDVLCPHK
jgi:hypothetical protein